MLRPGDFFGELAVVSPAPRNATAVAIDPTETLVVHRDEFQQLLDQQPSVQALLVEALVTEVRRLAVQLLDALYVPVERRVWRRLLELEAVFGDGSATTVISLTQEDLAQVVGTTRPTMNRLLRDGEAAGILHVFARSGRDRRPRPARARRALRAPPFSPRAARAQYAACPTCCNPSSAMLTSRTPSVTGGSHRRSTTRSRSPGVSAARNGFVRAYTASRYSRSASGRSGRTWSTCSAVCPYPVFVGSASSPNFAAHPSCTQT